MKRIELSQAKPITGIVVYRGPSKMDGSPIVVIATGLRGSENVKTGDMIQTYILVDGIVPTVGVFEGKDVGICGDCPHRYKDGQGTCYVNPANGPLAVYNAYRRGNYPEMGLSEAAELLAGRTVRLGAYGDPAMVPVTVWDGILKNVRAWTGYTHQWKRYFARGMKRYCMASVESVSEMERAHNSGWRTFRIRTAEMELLKGEIVCPASAEGGKRLNCVECKACDGGRVGKASVAIIAHGPSWKRKRLELMVLPTPLGA